MTCIIQFQQRGSTFRRGGGRESVKVFFQGQGIVREFDFWSEKSESSTESEGILFLVVNFYG